MPRPRKSKDEKRQNVQLDFASGLTGVVRSRRERFFLMFTAWVTAELGCEFHQLACTGLLLGTALVAFGKHLFYEGFPKYMFSETINAVVDRYRHVKTALAPAWGIMSRWADEEPSEPSMVMPEALLRAAFSVAIAWGWPLFGATLLLGFHGLLRPAEFLHLRRIDLVLPRDLLTDIPLVFVRLLNTKTKRFMRRQHARISDLGTVKFLDHLFGHLPYRALLFNCSAAIHRRRWDEVFTFLNVPVTEAAKGITPKSLRGSGATWLYQRTEDVDKIQWRGRWQARKNLEYYLQDVAGQILLTDLTESQKSKVIALAGLSDFALQLYLQG